MDHVSTVLAYRAMLREIGQPAVEVRASNDRLWLRRRSGTFCGVFRGQTSRYDERRMLRSEGIRTLRRMHP